MADDLKDLKSNVSREIQAENLNPSENLNPVESIFSRFECHSHPRMNWKSMLNHF